MKWNHWYINEENIETVSYIWSSACNSTRSNVCLLTVLYPNMQKNKSGPQWYRLRFYLILGTSPKSKYGLATVVFLAWRQFKSRIPCRVSSPGCRTGKNRQNWIDSHGWPRQPRLALELMGQEVRPDLGCAVLGRPPNFGGC